MTYNWQDKTWPNFIYNNTISTETLALFSLHLGELKGLMLSVSNKDSKHEIVADLMIDEAVNTSAIEGEYISRQNIMSSIHKNLGIAYAKQPADKRAVGIANVMLALREDYQKALSVELIQNWHRLLFEPIGLIHAGKWRSSEEPMCVMSGAIGKEIVHYEAPPSSVVPNEIERFVGWYNGFEANTIDFSSIMIKTAITHLFFESIHPFEDGNGRIGRSLAEKCLIQGLGESIPISLSKQIQLNKNTYYEELKKAQSSLEIDSWVNYFSNLIIDSLKSSVEVIHFTIEKYNFFEKYNEELNERQVKALKKMFDAGVDGFKGGMTAKKYISITGASKATATRDLQSLVSLGVLISEGVARSVHYCLNLR